MDELERRRRPQEEEYWFPYHYISRMPNAGFTQHFVDTWGINYISTIEFVLSKISECMPQSVIDIGCGDGRLTREIKRKFVEADILGVDYSKRAISLAEAMNQDEHGVKFEVIDIVKERFLKKYDVAVLMEVFEHIPLAEAEDFLVGVCRAIRPGGTLLLTVPHSNKPLEYKHFQHFTIDTITRYLAPNFEVVEVIPFEKRGFARRLLNRLLCNRLFVLNNRRLLDAAYKLHQKFLFVCADEQECQRIFVKAVIKST